jgi:hypothetical protein
MTRQLHDLFFKDYLTQLLESSGQVTTQQEIRSEAHYVDLSFLPQTASPLVGLGLLGRLVTQPCLLEHFRNSPTAAEVRTCLLKLFGWRPLIPRRGSISPMPR